MNDHDNITSEYITFRLNKQSVGQIMFSLQLQLFGVNPLTDKQKKALKKAEDDL